MSETTAAPATPKRTRKAAAPKSAPAPAAVEPSPLDKEIWESTIEGRIFVEVAGERGRTRQEQCKGKGSRIRLTREDRELAEERIRNHEHNPFRNGMLVLRNPRADHTSSADELTDEDLVDLFQLDLEDFQAAAAELSEVNVRRLLLLAVEHDASHRQLEFIREHIAATYPIGGDTPTYREMQARPSTAR